MRFLFQFFHRVDIDRVVKGAPWSFHNHLVVFHRLEDKEDPMLVPLIYLFFWVSVGRLTNICRVRERIDIRSLLKHIRKIQLSLTNHVYRELDESDIEWDMSLCAVGRRVATMESIWLRKGNKGGSSRDVFPNRVGKGGKWCNLGRMGLDPMRHDLEDNPIDGFDGNRRKITATFSRRFSECFDSSEERDEHLLACQSNVSVTAKGQAKLDQNRMERVRMKGGFVCGIEVVADGSKRDLVWVGD
ncbi:hypothetical protein Godav_010306 [Gossypium davidsonii]|uniref:DUF4283 domain-containing protein n=1 Tax=Gossypium davidsonii TaxID=34287 RepID=A0A7J8SG50_GOSDV|nr:hypothetical protein [Gossypium davidsonii]